MLGIQPLAQGEPLDHVLELFDVVPLPHEPLGVPLEGGDDAATDRGAGVGGRRGEALRGCLYDQAADRQTLKDKGLSELQPYLDRIDAVDSIEQMNELIASDDFPFNPFVTAMITTYDTRKSIVEPDEFFGLFARYPMKEVLAKLGMDGSEKFNVSAEWARAFDDMWVAENLDAIKLMAKARILKETRPYRDGSILIERGLYDGDADQDGWSACDNRNTLTHLVAQTYVEDCLDTGIRERLTELSKDIIDTYKDLVAETPWLAKESQRRVIEKLDHMTLNVLEPSGGYYDYSGLELTPTDEGGSLFSNYLKIKQYRADLAAEMVGQPANTSASWYCVEPTIDNAFYEPSGNTINIMPGYITTGNYAGDMSDEELLGDIGLTIGHEISHGFDYAGAQLDAYGPPNPVFADEDVDKFTDKTSALAAYYSSVELKPGVKVDGQNVVGEANADLSGMQAVLQIAAEDEDFDYDEFFADVAKSYAMVMTEESFAWYAADIQPLYNLRMNVNAQMFDTIYDEFGVAEGDGMYLAPDERIVMWGQDA